MDDNPLQMSKRVYRLSGPNTEFPYRKRGRISRTFLLKIFVSNRGCGLSARTSGHHAVNLHKLPLLKELLTSLTLPFLSR